MERLQTGYEELLSEVFEIEDFISEHTKDLTEKERSIIIDRYMLGKPWKRIQQDYNYAERQPYRIEGSAIKKLSAKMKDDSK